MKDKYLSILTNFGCHFTCPYCVVKRNEINVPKTTIAGLDNLKDEILKSGAEILMVSGGGDPLYEYELHVDWYKHLFSILSEMGGIPMELHTSYVQSNFPYEKCLRVAYHIRNILDLEKVKRHGNEVVRVVFVATKELSAEDIVWITRFVENSDCIDELSFRQMIGSNFETCYFNNELLRYGHEKGLWYYIEQCDYHPYYAEGNIYKEFSNIGKNYGS